MLAYQADVRFFGPRFDMPSIPILRCILVKMGYSLVSASFAQIRNSGNVDHLRFSPSDYRTIVRIAKHFEWPGLSVSIFHRVLVMAVGPETSLGKRLNVMPADEIQLLYDDVQSRCERFSDAELLLLAEAFAAVRYWVRRAHLLQPIFVQYFDERLPKLA